MGCKAVLHSKPESSIIPYNAIWAELHACMNTPQSYPRETRGVSVNPASRLGQTD